MQQLSFAFYLRKDKTNNREKAPVFGRVRLQNSQCTFSTTIQVDPKKWKNLKQFKKARLEEDLEIRNLLNALHQNFNSTLKKLNEDGKILNATQLKDEVFKPTLKLKKQFTVIDAFESHYKHFALMVKAGERSNSTLCKFGTTKKHIQSFIKKEYGVSDLPLTALNFEFIDGFHSYMRLEAGCDHNYTVRRCEFVKSVIKLARKREWLEKDPFMLYDKRREEVKTIYLTKDEVRKILELKIQNPEKEIAKFLFLFTVYTGLAGADVAKLTPEHIVKHSDNRNWIFTQRTKTKVESNVPIFFPAAQIIEKYKNHPYCVENNRLLPKKSNQKINKHLKDIAQEVGIKKNLTYYVARHTFATTICLANGVSLEALSKMMGHKRITQTQQYAKILNTMVSEETKQLNDKLLIDYPSFGKPN